MSDKIALYSYSKIIERQDNGEYERLVTSIVADPENVDSYGGVMDADTIERACYMFMEVFRNYGVDHVKNESGEYINHNEGILLVENWINRSESVINNTVVPKGAWVQTWRIVDDDIWEGVLREDYNGFSLVGLAKKIPLEDNENGE